MTRRVYADACCDFCATAAEVARHRHTLEQAYAHGIEPPPKGWRLLECFEEVTVPYREFVENDGWGPAKTLTTMTPLFARPRFLLRAYAVPA